MISRVRLLSFICCCLPAAAEPAVADQPIDYVQGVKSILAKHCTKCHGAGKQENDLRLDSTAAARAGGYGGPAIVPGDGAGSRLILAVTGSDELERMPPKGPRLTDREIDILRRWIDQGARAPALKTLANSARGGPDHWSFQPVVRPDVPQVKNTGWVLGAIDAFILARLEKEGIEPSPVADRVTLIRRLSLDLVGLPPTLAEVDNFVNDQRPDAYAHLVDRLLASPHYGERWGRHWLDVARYADSNGYTNDNPRSIWKYRDWVIDAMNRDLPFDQFAIQQIAGDLLPEATTDTIVATGFHRNTQLNQEGGSDPEEYRVVAVVDRVNTTGTVFLGLTIGCAQCHDHKFDPIGQRDYYRLFAFLNNADEPRLPIPSAAEAEEQDKLKAEIAAAEAELKQHERAVSESDLQKQPIDAKNDESAENEESDPVRAQLTARLEQLRKLEKQLAGRIPTTLVMRPRDKARMTHIHVRGDFLRNGEQVQPGIPEVLPELPDDVTEPNRLDFAQWLVSAENPLTPRVTINRIWQRYFGRGIVETENDFGTQGTPPTHPELLDWLAAEFVARGWSMKQMHRLIVSSATYRQASTVRPELVEIDPKNGLLARQSRQRLDAEIIRDSALRVAGLLSEKIGGPSVFPPQPDGVMKLTRNPNRKWNVSRGEDRYRRGMYTYFWRSTPHPFLKVFNSPDSNATCTRRDRANTPLQALTLLNDEAVFEAAQALAVRVLRETPDCATDQRLRYAFRLCLARRPTDNETNLLQQLFSAELADDEGAEPAVRFAALDRLPAGTEPREVVAWTSVARALLNLDEFITRE